MRLGGLILVSVLVMTAGLPHTAADDHRDPLASCGGTTTDVTVETFTLRETPEKVLGCYAYPAAGKSTVTTLVVFAHGLGWTVQAGWTGHMVEVVEAAPATAIVAPNYRDNFGFPVMGGAEDLILATKTHLDDLENAGADVDQVVVFGVSMGAAISGTAIHHEPDLFDVWFDVEGVSNLFETYTEARLVAPGVPFAADVVAGIERDAGGTPLEEPGAYALRSPALNADAMAAAGLSAVVLVHAVNDGLVPYDQGREMNLALKAAGVTAEMHTVVRGEADHTQGTTPTHHAIPDDGQDPNEQYLDLAGHASEGDGGHVVMRTALDRLVTYLAGTDISDAEHVVDAQLA